MPLKENLELFCEVTKIIFFVSGTIGSIFFTLNNLNQIKINQIRMKQAELSLEVLQTKLNDTPQDVKS